MRLVLLAFFGIILFVSGSTQAQDKQHSNPYPADQYTNPYPNPANPYPYPQSNPYPQPNPPQDIINPRTGESIYPQPPVRPGEETGEIPDGPFKLCDRKFDSIFFAFRDIRGDLELSFTEEDQRYEYYEDYQNSITWVLTKKLFEAHPSIMCKEIITQHGKKLKSITMYCGAKAETCERFQKALNGE